jgi:nicotinic acid phosphoribosyltransferase
MSLPVPSALATDLYQLTMMAGYEAAGHSATSTFELFVRVLPASRRYLMVAGLAQALDYLEGLHFTPDEIVWLRTVPALTAAPIRFFDEVLPAFRFTGEVWAMDEGEIAFQHEPFVRVTAPVMEAQIVETALLAILFRRRSPARPRASSRRLRAGWWPSSDRAVLTVWKPRAWRRARRASRDAPRRRTSKPGACSICRSPARWRTRG